MEKDMETRIDKACNISGIDRKKYLRISSFFKMLFELFDEEKINKQELELLVKEVGDLIREAEEHAGTWSETAT